MHEDDLQDWRMITQDESAIRSSDARSPDSEHTESPSHDSSSWDENVGNDLGEFLRAVYEAQSRLHPAA